MALPTVFPLWLDRESAKKMGSVPASSELTSESKSSPDGVEGSVVSTEQAKVSTTLPGKVEKVIAPPPGSGEPEKAQVAVEGADHLYREIRIPNRLTDADGKTVKLKEGADVEVTIEAEPAATSAASTAQ